MKKTSLFALLLVGCGSSGSSAPPPAEAPDAATPAPSASDAGSTPPMDAAPQPMDSGASALAVTFPQAIDGAFWANPDVYATIPVRVLVTGGDADAVSVSIMGTPTSAMSKGGGTWIAN